MDEKQIIAENGHLNDKHPIGNEACWFPEIAYITINDLRWQLGVLNFVVKKYC
jgi:hypothetical protein